MDLGAILDTIMGLLGGVGDLVPAELMALFTDLFDALIAFCMGLLDYFMSFLG